MESVAVCASLRMELTLSVLSPGLTLPLPDRKPNLLSEPGREVGREGAGATEEGLWSPRGLAPAEPLEAERVLQGEKRG